MARSFAMPGDMDAASMKEQRPVLDELASANEDLTIDMSKVEFIDSSGVGALVFIYKRLLSSGFKLKLESLKGQPLQLLTYLRLTDIVAR